MRKLQESSMTESGAEHMLDRKKLDTKSADHYVALFSEVEHLKAEFLREYGVAADNFNPVEIEGSLAWKKDRSDTYNKIIQFGPDAVPFFKDYKFVEDKIKQAYVSQFPDDQELLKIDENMPKLELSAEV